MSPLDICLSSTPPVDQTNNQPVYGLPLEQHLDIIGQPVSTVIHDCSIALPRESSAAKLKLLRSVHNNGHRTHTHTQSSDITASAHYNTLSYSKCSPTRSTHPPTHTYSFGDSHSFTAQTTLFTFCSLHYRSSL